MKFDCAIIGGGLAGLTAGIELQESGLSSVIISGGQSALHFFSGTFESMKEAPSKVRELFDGAGIRIHYREGVRLMPMGKLRDAELSLEDIGIMDEDNIARKVLIVNFAGYNDFFPAFIAQGLQEKGISCKISTIRIEEMEHLRQSPSEMRSVQIARKMDRIWEKVVQETRMLLRDEDCVILPQVFGLKDTSVPGRIREALPAKVIFAGTLPPSVPGVRTQMQLRKRYQTLGGTFLLGDVVTGAHVHEGTVHSIVTKNLENHFIEAKDFILASGGYFSKGLVSTPTRIYEPVFGLDVEYSEDRNSWYNPDFSKDQPYMGFGVRTNESLRAIKDGEPLKNLYAIGSILGNTREEEYGHGGGAALRTAFKAVNQILEK